MTAIGAITLLLALQLAGEAIARGLSLPVPGPVIGMVMLFAGLVAWGSRGHQVPAALDTVGGWLLSNLSLLFVPAGVGVMLHLGLVRSEWLPLTTSLVVSAVLTIAVTAWIMATFGRAAPDPDDAEDGTEPTER